MSAGGLHTGAESSSLEAVLERQRRHFSSPFLKIFVNMERNLILGHKQYWDYILEK
jgi:hypothetical protein